MEEKRILDFIKSNNNGVSFIQIREKFIKKYIFETKEIKEEIRLLDNILLNLRDENKIKFISGKYY